MDIELKTAERAAAIDGCSRNVLRLAVQYRRRGMHKEAVRSQEKIAQSRQDWAEIIKERQRLGMPYKRAFNAYLKAGGNRLCFSITVLGKRTREEVQRLLEENGIFSQEAFLAAANERCRTRLFDEYDYRKMQWWIADAIKAKNNGRGFIKYTDAGGVANSYKYSTTSSRMVVYIDPYTNEVIAEVGRTQIGGRSVPCLYRGAEPSYWKAWSLYRGAEPSYWKAWRGT